MTAALSIIPGLQAGQATARGFRSQAMQTRMQAKGEELKYKQQGVAVLDNILRTQATLNARAGAGGIDPFSGSANALQQYALAQGAKENYTTMDNAIIAVRSGELQAQEYESAARSAISQSRMGAVMSVLQSAAQVAMLVGGGGLPGGGQTTGINPFAGGTPTGVGLPGGEFGMTNLNVSGPGQLGAMF